MTRYMTPRNAIRECLADGRTKEQAVIVQYAKSKTKRAAATIERTLRDMLQNGQVEKVDGWFRLVASATVSTASPPPHGGVAVRRAAARGGGRVAEGAENDAAGLDDDDPDPPDDDVETVAWVTLRRTRKLSSLTDRQLRWMARRGYLRLSVNGRAWYDEEPEE